MKIILQREKEDSKSTLGRLFFDSADYFSQCFTLEDQKQEGEKVYGETRIPSGTYGIKLRTEGVVNQKYTARYGDMHKGMLWLQDIPNFEYILIHTGNTDEHTHGCLLVGLTSQNSSIHGNGTGLTIGSSIISHSGYTIGQSGGAYKKIYPTIADAILRDEKVTIQIRDIRSCINEN